MVSDADQAMELAEHRALSEYDHQLLMIGEMQLRGAKALCKMRTKAAGDPSYEIGLRTLVGTQADGYKMLRAHLQ